MTRRRWIAEHWDEATATIEGAQAEHLARVLRAQPGMEADVVAGGRVFHAEVAAVTQTGETSEVRFNLVAELDADPALPVTLVMAVYKFDRMEWAIEKATELGVAAIAPVIARRTEKHLSHAAEKRAERWRRIAHEASQQARRSDVPVIHEPVDLADARARRVWSRLRASCLPSRSARPRCARQSRKLSKRRKTKCLRSRLLSGPKADGLPPKKLCSTTMAGAPRRSVRAFFALRQRPSRRWRSLRRAWSDCASSGGSEPSGDSRLDCGKARQEAARRVGNYKCAKRNSRPASTAPASSPMMGMGA